MEIGMTDEQGLRVVRELAIARWKENTPASGVGFRALAEAPCGSRSKESIRMSDRGSRGGDAAGVFGGGAKDGTRGGRDPLCIADATAQFVSPK